MRITPLDVRKQEFRRSVRGFDCDEVRAFLATLADEYEIVLVDNKQIREKVMLQEEKIREYKAVERTLRDTLMTAEKLMQETRENANKEGELIVQEAKLKAKEILQECRLRTEELRREIEGLRKEKENYMGRFKSLAESQIQFIESHRTDFKDLDDRLTGIVDSVVDGISTRASEAEKEAVVETIVEALIQPEYQGPREKPEPVASGSFAADPVVDVWRSYSPAADRGPGQGNAGQTGDWDRDGGNHQEHQHQGDHRDHHEVQNDNQNQDYPLKPQSWSGPEQKPENEEVNSEHQGSRQEEDVTETLNI